MSQSSMSYREKLRQKQQQEVNDKGKTGLGRASLLDFSKSPIPVNSWTPRYMPEENAFDILPFIITQSWFKNLRSPSGRPMNLDIGDMWYKLQVPFHSGVGPGNGTYLCLREAFGLQCEVCDQMFEFYKTGKPEDKEKGKKIRPRWRTFYNIYDYEDSSKGFQLWEISYYCFEATTTMDPQRANLLDAQVLDNGELVIFSDLEEGSTIIGKFKKKALGEGKNRKEFPEIVEIKFESPRDPYTMNDLANCYPLDAMLVVPTPEDVRNAFYGLDEDGANTSQESENQTENQPSTSGRTRQRPTPQENINRTRSTEPDPPEPPNQKGTCPAGGVFGADCNKLPACNGQSVDSCSEPTFQDCLKKHEELSSAQTSTAQPDPPQQEQQSRSRTRGATTSTPADTDTQSQTDAPRRRRR